MRVCVYVPCARVYVRVFMRVCIIHVCVCMRVRVWSLSMCTCVCVRVYACVHYPCARVYLRMCMRVCGPGEDQIRLVDLDKVNTNNVCSTSGSIAVAPPHLAVRSILSSPLRAVVTKPTRRLAERGERCRKCQFEVAPSD